MNFTSSEAKGLVIGATAGAGILAAADQIANGNPPNIRIAVGGVVAAAILYGMADWMPALAGALALLLLLGAVLTNGVNVAKVITEATN